MPREQPDSRRTDDTVAALLESLPESAFLIDREGTIITANARFAGRFSMCPHECTGMNVYDLVATGMQMPELAGRHRENVQEVLRTGKSAAFEEETNNRFWKITINPVLSPEGKITRLFVTTGDTSEQKRFEKQLVKECALKTAILDEMPGCAAVLDANGKLIVWNQYARELILGKMQGSEKNVDYRKIISADNIFPVKEKFHNILNSGNDEGSEVKINPPGSDAAQWIAARGRRISIEGQPCIVAVGMDITEKKRLEEVLEENELKFRSIFNNSPIAIGIIDIHDDLLIDANPSWLELFGYEKPEIRNKPVSDIGLEVLRNNDADNLQARSGWKTVTNAPLFLRKRSGEQINVLYSSEVVALGDKSVLLVMMTDITLQKLQQQSIDQLEKAVVERTRQLQEEVERLQRFLGMISHEYRTPLAIIRSNLDLIKLKNKAGNFSYKVEISKINRAIDRLVEVMEVSIEETRVSRSQKASTLTRFPIVPVLSSQVETFRKMWTERSIDYSETAGSCKIFGEASQIKFAIFNLLDNARKYSPPDSEIEVECSVEHDDAVIRIRNEGAGFTRKEGESFFEKYFRGNNSVNTAGAGLGLWLVRNIINQHKGKVSLEGKVSGVEATIRLPLAPESELCARTR